MDSIDATVRESGASVEGVTPASLLTIILDTNPIAWDSLSPALPLSQAISNLLLFINAHLAINGSNQVAVLASHTDRIAWLYPSPEAPSPASSPQQKHKQNGIAHPEESANASKYRPFLIIEQQILSNLRKLIDSTDIQALAERANANCTQLAGSFTTALTYINQQTLLASPPRDGVEVTLQTTQSAAKSDAKKLISRVMVVSVSSDLADQYISVMNSIFAAQRLRIPIDVLKLAGSTTFLQQASDATQGVYLSPSKKELRGLLQYLMMAYLPDPTSRALLNMPGKTDVDFRAACFCHRNVVDVGYVCSVCLSIFCDPTVLPNSQCLTCGTLLTTPVGWGVKPALTVRKKKKKKLADGGVGGAT